MPLGRYPDRVRPFRKWATEMVDKATISNSATGFRKRSSRAKLWKRRRRKKKKEE